MNLFVCSVWYMSMVRLSSIPLLLPFQLPLQKLGLLPHYQSHLDLLRPLGLLFSLQKRGLLHHCPRQVAVVVVIDMLQQRVWISYILMVFVAFVALLILQRVYVLVITVLKFHFYFIDLTSPFTGSTSGS